MRSVQDAALIGRNHILDVNKGVFTAVDLEHFQGLLNQISQVLGLALRVVDLIAKIVVADLEKVENWQDLSVVGDQGLTDGV